MLDKMARRRLADTGENVLSFARLSTPESCETALNFVYQAADIFRSIKDQAEETETRARALCKIALERAKSAEMRTEAAERALIEARLRIEVAEDKQTALEFRAQAAEDEARRAKLALAERVMRRT